MCGIFGTITKKGLNAREISGVKESLRHRGPDGEGEVSFKLTSGSMLDLVHLRLSIIDLSQEASQPMSYGKDLLYIVYNGEIFNYIELKEELKGKGYEFRTESDTEVVLASYKEWGEACVNHFNGDWAFCIYDKSKDLLFFSRDRLGVKPLYYFQDEENFAFSSEIKAFFKLPFIKNEWNRSAVSTFTLLGVSDFSEETMYKGIYQVEPATNMLFDIKSGEVTHNKYWDPSFNPSSEKFDSQKEVKYKEDIRGLLEDAVRLRLRSDVPVGTCLSGGIDSSIVTALINNLVRKKCPDAASIGEKQKTFTAAYKGELIDEEKWAKVIIDSTGADGKFVYPTSEDLVKDLDDFMQSHDEMCLSTSMYAQYRVMKLASRDVKVVLDGQGADELFGGYSSYKGYNPKNILDPKGIKGVFQRKVFPRLPESLKKKAAYASYWKKAGIVEEVVGSTIDFDAAASILSQRVPLGLNQALYMDETKYNLQQLLRYEDRNSMRFSVEARVPFTDYRLVEYALNIPASYKIHNGWTKYILRKAAEDLVPPEVVWRKDKIGFQTPEKKWLRDVHEFRYVLNKFNKSKYDGEYFWWRVFNFFKF